MKKGTLITSLSKKVPLINAVKVAAKKVGAFETIHGTDSNPDVVGKYFVDRFWPLEVLDFDSLVALCRQEEIGAIIPTRDEELVFFAKTREQFAKEGISVFVSPAEAIAVCQDKLVFAEKLRNHAFPSIHTSLEPSRHFEYWVVKERFSKDGRDKGLCLSKEEALAFGQRLKMPIYQPYIEGRELSIDVYGSQGAVVRERNLISHGESAVTTTIDRPDLAKMTEEMAHFLGLEHHSVFQGIETLNADFFFLECNPRFGGASTLAIAAGLDSFTSFFSSLLGEPLPPRSHFQIGLRQIRYPVDLIFTP